MVRRLRLCAWIAATLLGLACDIAVAASSLYRFEARLEDGPLLGTTFEGTFAFDAAASTGHGEEFLSLAALDFDLLGTHFSRDDIRQGGQAILVDGQLSFFTAAFFPPPPASAPVTDIAFGFGGPGVIGYVVGRDFEHGFGNGAVTLMAPVPEPSVAVLVAAGLLALISFGRLGWVQPTALWRCDLGNGCRRMVA